MRYQLNMGGRYISRKGKKIFNDINQIPLYLYDVIEESLEQMKGVYAAKSKILNCFHITAFPEEMNAFFKQGYVAKVKIDLSDKPDDDQEIDEKASNLAQDQNK